MHLKTTDTHKYKHSRRKKIFLFFIFLFILFILVFFSLTSGAYNLSIAKIFQSISGSGDASSDIVIFNIRLPRIAAAIVAGWGLGLSGAVMQILLKNPVASPFTLGISQGAAFGAAFAIMILGAGTGSISSVRTSGSGLINITNIYLISISAFIGAVAVTLIILAISSIKKLSSESLILAGVALSSLASSGTILLQYFASDVELASIVFWTFGDVSRSSWNEIWVMAFSVAAGALYFYIKKWDLNTIAAGEDFSRSVGVRTKYVRFIGMLCAAMIAGIITAFHGVIAFLGLLAPHIARMITGDDSRLLLPYSGLIGATLLLSADTIGRGIIGSGTLPVGVITSFLGAPLFLHLLLRKKQ